MAKDTCEAAKRMPISFLKANRYLDAYGYSGSLNWSVRGQPTGKISIEVDAENKGVRCQYTRTTDDDKKEDFDYTVSLVQTRCYFGGKRFWLVCPLVRDGIPCLRRVGVLYLEGRYFGCRKCHDLAYETQQETHTGRWSAIHAFFKLESYITSQETKLRVKYWKGQPTKHYQKVLSAYRRLGRLNPVIKDMMF